MFPVRRGNIFNFDLVLIALGRENSGSEEFQVQPGLRFILKYKLAEHLKVTSRVLLYIGSRRAVFGNPVSRKRCAGVAPVRQRF